MLERKAAIRDRILRERFEAKRREQALEEQYDKMVNPHLYGTGAGGGYRKLRKGEHYEDVQREHLANEIRIRERRERYKSQRYHENEYRGNPRDRDGRRPPPRGGHRRDRYY